MKRASLTRPVIVRDFTRYRSQILVSGVFGSKSARTGEGQIESGNMAFDVDDVSGRKMMRKRSEGITDVVDSSGLGPLVIWNQPAVGTLTVRVGVTQQTMEGWD